MYTIPSSNEVVLHDLEPWPYDARGYEVCTAMCLYNVVGIHSKLRITNCNYHNHIDFIC